MARHYGVDRDEDEKGNAVVQVDADRDGSNEPGNCQPAVEKPHRLWIATKECPTEFPAAFQHKSEAQQPMCQPYRDKGAYLAMEQGREGMRLWSAVDAYEALALVHVAFEIRGSGLPA